MKSLHETWAAPAAVLVLATSCAGGIRLTSQWSDPAFRASSLHDVLVLGVSDRPHRVRALEQAMVGALAGRGLAVHPADSLRGDSEGDCGELGARALRRGCDGLMVTRLLGPRGFRAHYPTVASYVAVPAGYDSGWCAYVRAGRQRAGAAPESLEDQSVRLEANLYRLPEDRLAWTALSEPFMFRSASLPADLAEAAGKLATVLVPERPRRRR